MDHRHLPPNSTFLPKPSDPKTDKRNYENQTQETQILGLAQPTRKMSKRQVNKNVEDISCRPPNLPSYGATQTPTLSTTALKLAIPESPDACTP